MSSTLRKTLIFCLWSLLGISMITCCVLPALGVYWVFSRSAAGYSPIVYLQVVIQQWLGPAYTLTLGSFLVILSLRGKRVKWGLWAITLIGPVYTVYAAAGVVQGYSITVFGERSGIYGNWILSLSIAGGVCLVALASLNFTRRLRLNITGTSPKR